MEDSPPEMVQGRWKREGETRGRQERPRRLQEGLKSAQGGSKKASRAAKLHPRCLAKMPCRELTNGHAESSRAGGGVPPKGKAIRRHPKGRRVTEQFSNFFSNI